MAYTIRNIPIKSQNARRTFNCKVAQTEQYHNYNWGGAAYDAVAKIQEYVTIHGGEIDVSLLTFFVLYNTQRDNLIKLGIPKSNIISIQEYNIFPITEGAGIYTDIWTMPDGKEYTVKGDFRVYEKADELFVRVDDFSVLDLLGNLEDVATGGYIAGRFSAMSYPVQPVVVGQSRTVLVTTYFRYTWYGLSPTGILRIGINAASFPDTITSFLAPTQQSADFLNSLLADIPENTDPYDPGGVDEGDPNGGDGTFDDTSDDIPEPDWYPNLSLNRGFCRIWQPTSDQLSAVAEWLWSSDFFEIIKKLFGDPMSAIFALHALPTSPVPSIGAAFRIGNVDSGLVVNAPTTGYTTIDCGTFDFARYWGSALDYSPYTRVSLYLPYVGVVPLNVDDIQQKTLHITYRIELLTGNFLCLVSANGDVFYRSDMRIRSALVMLITANCKPYHNWRIVFFRHLYGFTVFVVLCVCVGKIPFRAIICYTIIFAFRIFFNSFIPHQTVK